MKILKKFCRLQHKNSMEKLSHQVYYLGSHNECTMSKKGEVYNLGKRDYFSDHYPVLYQKIIEIIGENLVHSSKLNQPFLVGDLTMGLANHSFHVLKNFDNSYVMGIDIDPDMIKQSKVKLSQFITQNRAIIAKDSYTESRIVLNQVLRGAKTILSKSFNGQFKKNKRFDYAIIDLGFNSVQLSDEKRGFSFKLNDSRLDMRYDSSNVNIATAAEILNNSTELELILMFQKYAEEKYAETLVKKLIEYRGTHKFNTVKDFNDVIDLAFPSLTNKERYNTYSRLYQALRISVNYELLNLQRFLENIPLSMESNSLLFAICFHSLELKAVKKSFKFYEKIKLGKIKHKSIIADEEELSENSRSKSATMLVFEFNNNLEQ